MSEPRKIITARGPSLTEPDEFDWRAVYEDHKSGDPIGWGETEQEAIADLTEWDEENDL
jgi:hypothetical protein